MRLFARVFVSLSLFAAAVPASFASPTYSVQSLGEFTWGAGSISSGGAGYYTDAAGDLTPAVFSSAGITSLPGMGMASGRNTSGTVIGTTFTDTSISVTEWVNGQSKATGLSGEGNAINDAGQIAGGYLTSRGALHAFVETGTTVRDLGTLGGSSSSALALNATGQAAGESTIRNGDSHAFFWDGYSMHDLGTLGGTDSYGEAINDSGEVAGTAQTRAGYLNAFVSSASGLVDLGTLGGKTSAAYGVNNSGEVVGYSTLANGSTHGFLDSNGSMLDMNSLLPLGTGWTITAAYAIDNQGDIFATALHNDDDYAVELYQGAGAGFSGVPEPGMVGLAGIGFVVLALVGRRKHVLVKANRS